MLRFFKKPSWDLGSVSAPWGDRPSIYAYVAGRVQSGRRFPTADERLPDEARVAGQTGFRWAPGALDGAFGHHGGGESSETGAELILVALKALTEKASTQRARTLYVLLTKYSTIDHVDSLLPLITQSADLRSDRVLAVARWLATEAPDREPVKTAMAILGVVSLGEDSELLLTLGRHEEFTLFASVALQHTEKHPDAKLWELAQHVTGWGRIHIIERLAATQDEQVKAWLLRHGYRNDIMDEYTALICARTGNLVDALRAPHPDRSLLKGAGAIIAALIRGGPAEGIEAYADGPESTERYLQHIGSHEADYDLEDFNNVVTIERFVEEERSKAGEFAADWRRRAAAISDHIRAIRERPDWHAKVQRGLSSDDRLEFSNAAEAAKAIGIDTWDVYFQRLERGEENWYYVMQTDDPQRVDRVVGLAEARLPLDDIASGPSDELGLGPEFRHHSALDFVLQDLRRFPGKGWRLVRAGLRSPVTRNRNMAVRALAEWGRATWPPETELLLRHAAKAEPNEDTRRDMQKVLSGEPLELD